MLPSACPHYSVHLLSPAHISMPFACFENEPVDQQDNTNMHLNPCCLQVDEHGNPLAIGPPAASALHMSMSGSSNDSTAKQQPQQQQGQASPTNSTFAGMDATQRSLTIWKHVSPGMLPGTSTTPQTTTQETYAYEPEKNEATDFTHHLKKTDFAEYTECALRHMHHIKAAAKK
eukprot:GHRR01017251.1.p1 GENE.GHRR01017251.1~~GHRR01017251.1.p1  ORF type:complete len:174 (-),score=63.67 GHRR01017251.1:2478-2999(-)